MAKTGHIDQVRVFHQSEPLGRCSEGGEIVSDLEHTARHRRQGDRYLCLFEGERTLSPVPILIVYGLRRDGERVRVCDEEVAIHIVAGGYTRGCISRGIEFM